MRHFAGIALLYLLLASLYHVAVPLGEGPDEPGHMRYVLFLASQQRLPVQRQPYETSDVPGEGHQPPLAYLLATPAALWLPTNQRTLSLTANPQFTWSGGNDPAAFMRASNQYMPWQGVTLAWHLARGFSTLWGLVTLACIWGIARTLAPDDVWLAVLATTLTATLPQFLFTSVLVTNDALLIALAAAILWGCVALLATAPHPHRLIALLGLLCGLALLTKQSALLLLPIAAWSIWRVEQGRGVLLWAALTTGVAGWWYFRNLALYGDPMGLQSFRSTYATDPMRWADVQAWRSALGQLLRSSWALFGWINLPAPRWVYALYALVGGVAGAGWLLRRQPLPVTWLPVLFLPLLTLAWLLSFAAVAGLVAWQGRLLFPALATFALLLAGGLRHLPRLPRGALLAGLALLTAWLPLGVIVPAYPWYTLPATRAQQQVGTPTYARYAAAWEQGIELHGWYTTPTPPLHAGQPINITLTWHALERVPHDWTVFVHLVDQQGNIVAEHNSRPQVGQFPMPLWTPGDWLHDSHPLLLPADLPTGTYALRVGLYRPWQRDPRRGERQPVWAADGQPLGDYATVGTLRVE